MTRSFDRVCQCCGAAFIAGHLGARWCSITCKMRAYQRRRRGAPESDPRHALAIQNKINTITDQPSPLPAFSFESQQLRVITDEHGAPWFVAADLLASLALDRKALERLDDDEKGVSSIHTLP